MLVCEELDDLYILNLNRNARMPKSANTGARPCSSYMRKLRAKWYHRNVSNVEESTMDENYFRDFDGYEDDEVGASATKEEEDTSAPAT